MHSSVVFMLFLALSVMVFIKGNDARRIQIDNDDDNDFEISDLKAREFLNFADEYAKRANGNCITCSILTQSKCCAPDICVKKTLHNECIKVKPGK